MPESSFFDENGLFFEEAAWKSSLFGPQVHLGLRRHVSFPTPDWRQKKFARTWEDDLVDMTIGVCEGITGVCEGITGVCVGITGVCEGITGVCEGITGVLEGLANST